MKYLPRIADMVLKERLAAFGAVLIEGPKWTGKTTTAMQQAQSILQLQDPDRKATAAMSVEFHTFFPQRFQFFLHCGASYKS